MNRGLANNLILLRKQIILKLSSREALKLLLGSKHQRSYNSYVILSFIVDWKMMYCPTLPLDCMDIPLQPQTSLRQAYMYNVLVFVGLALALHLHVTS